MKLTYLIGASHDMYRGRFPYRGRHLSFGTHSFIYDLVRVGSRLGHDWTIVLDEPELFPLSAALRHPARVVKTSAWSPEGTDGAIAEYWASDESLSSLPARTPLIAVVHNSDHCFSSFKQDRANAVLCMSPTSLVKQRRTFDPEKLFLSIQGVDLDRFSPTRTVARRDGARPRVLVASRIDDNKQDAVRQVVDRLVERAIDLTVLGDGAGFWDLSDRLGHRLTLINHIPCHSIHRFLPQFDLVVSSARGVMEAFACGLPALCVGLDYGGAVTPDRLDELLERNLTGHASGRNLDQLDEDLTAALAVAGSDCRRIAEERFDATRVVEQLVAVFDRVRPINAAMPSPADTSVLDGVDGS
ncbi:hypothetical protein Pan216_48600 [Planctomycetes bacterium Pan216]|uniref:Glycosyl transferases group 1 n=1 Tax=Kolteria novifilia TaxID=2527975 RepID=A0A518BAH5_9BACT|nr:hypothetical protein Pan216_48600 [Planctomycetes bacterium Pan216]